MSISARQDLLEGGSCVKYFTKCSMARHWPPRSHENDCSQAYFHCENVGGDWPPAGLTHIFTGLQQEECLTGDPSAGPGASPPPDRDGRDFLEARFPAKGRLIASVSASALVNVQSDVHPPSERRQT